MCAYSGNCIVVVLTWVEILIYLVAKIRASAAFPENPSNTYYVD